MGDPDLEAAVGALARRLLRGNQRICAAESCTGGWVAKACTDLAGSSDWFDRGFVTYSNAAKRDMLDVPESVLARHGAVSRETVCAMTAGALSHSAADFAVAISGIAGPGGGTVDKPVGTVWFAWQARGADPITGLHRLPGDREAVRRRSVLIALEGLSDLIDEIAIVSAD